MEGHTECTMVLLEERCDVEAREENGHTALHEACWNGYSRTVDALVKIGKANIHATNKNGQKPIHLAVQNGHNETTRVLLKAGTNPDVRNNASSVELIVFLQCFLECFDNRESKRMSPFLGKLIHVDTFHGCINATGSTDSVWRLDKMLVYS
ncbi:hypothetical protein BSL78_09984 [Apostichopus japonicus]|uniref:Uncharacterized protein n=1 Tax=Stichopus japonicus TaxID=307972 RepID=A0A2G8KYL8_STIJA|nr:hypothetical protein BSL78_09984 [Apostichopus japonicus]